MSRYHQSLGRGQCGFTLVESVIVITLIGILATIAAMFIVQPFEAARDMTRRAELVDSAETALSRMTSEIRLAVPNSVRISGDSLEFLRTVAGGRYRRLPAGGGSGDPLRPALANDTFDVLGGLPGNVATRSPGRNCANGSGDCLVINNTGTSGFNAYARDNIAAIVSAQPDPSEPTELGYDTGGSSPAFRAHSANQRFQVVDTVVSYVCSGGQINRHHDYGLNSTQNAAPGGTVSLVARDVTACSFDYDSGAGARHGLVTIDITIRRAGETVRLVDQAHVVNVP